MAVLEVQKYIYVLKEAKSRQVNIVTTSLFTRHGFVVKAVINFGCHHSKSCKIHSSSHEWDVFLWEARGLRQSSVVSDFSWIVFFFLVLLQGVLVNRITSTASLLSKTPATGMVPPSQLWDKGTKFSTDLYLVIGFLCSDEVHLARNQVVLFWFLEHDKFPALRWFPPWLASSAPSAAAPSVELSHGKCNC